MTAAAATISRDAHESRCRDIRHRGCGKYGREVTSLSDR
jgi:hypothetical protein